MRHSLLTVLLFSLASSLGAVAPPSEPGHWAFRSPRRHPLPAVRQIPRCRNPIDRFILARLEAVGLSLAPETDRAGLLRRVSFDLTGLPPTPEQMADFLADSRPDAYQRVVDRLLASPHFGERWGQHWLDVARYADTNGYEADGERPQAWRYRDWVVSAMNNDLPYDQFLTRQIAGDLLHKDHPGAIDLLIASGFNRCGQIHQVSGNIDPVEIRHEMLTEMTAGIGTAFLGLTLNCARCHDHKFDPISQEDYYRIEAFFSATKAKQVDLATAPQRLSHAKETAVIQARLVPIRNELAKIEGPYRNRIRAEKQTKLEAKYREALAVEGKKRTPEQQKLVAQAQTLLKVTWDEIVDALNPTDREKRTALRRQMHAITALSPAPLPSAWTLEESSDPLRSNVLRRGNPHRKGEEVKPGFPEFLRHLRGPEPGNRLTLSRWLAQPDHPLTARVIVNRLWQYHFGRGIVATSNDFGLKGDRPSHPELLDWLAVELVESGWSLKHIHRLIVLSATYRQSSAVKNDRAASMDPNNRLLWRKNRWRLQAEAIRDATLAVSGNLTPWIGGAPVRVPLEPEVYDLIFTEGEPDNLWPVTLDVRQHDRRAIYLINKRNVRLPLLETFDQPDTLTSCPVRSVSTFAPQALILFNGPFMHEQSRVFASRLYREAGSNRKTQVSRAYQLALGRTPTAKETETALAFLSEQTDYLRDQLRGRITLPAVMNLPTDADPAAGMALADFCLALLNSNGFVHVE